MRSSWGPVRCSRPSVWRRWKNSLTGLEFAYGIPGTVGGAVYMDAGAYGGEMKDVLASVRYLTGEGEIVEAPAEQLDLRYRHSIFEEKRRLHPLGKVLPRQRQCL